MTYTLAWISHQTGQRLELDPIWQEQGLSEELKEVIAKVAEQAHYHLVHNAGGRNVTEWAKREECWVGFRKTEISVKIPMRKSGTNGEVKTPVGILIDPGHPVLLLGGAGWKSLAAWAKETGNLQSWQRSLAYSVGRVLTDRKQPSEKQLQHATRILEESSRLGFKI